MGACGSQQEASQPATPCPEIDVDADIVDCKRATSPQCYSCFSCTDRDLGIKPHTEKRVKNSASMDWGGVGHCCRKGLKPARAKSSPNQDAWSVLITPNGCRRVYGVFDGHGDKGHEAADMAKDVMPKMIARNGALEEDDLKPTFKDAFRRMQAMVSRRKWSELSGTTATIVVHDATRGKLSIAHVGDSSAVLGRVSGSENERVVKAVPLTRDHKPELEDERKRIEARGGRVMNDAGNYRVVKRGQLFPGLNMSRSIGDVMAHNLGVLAEPELSEHTLDSNDHLLLLASDGIWEVVSPQEAIEIVVEAGGLSCPKKAADALASEASRRWLDGTNGVLSDDITVVLVNLKHQCFSPGLKRSDTANSSSTMAPSNFSEGFGSMSDTDGNEFVSGGEDNYCPPTFSSAARRAGA